VNINSFCDQIAKKSHNRGVATIRDKIVETLSSNGVTSKNKTIHISPPSHPFKVEVFAVSYEGTSTAMQHCKEWGGGAAEGKTFSSPLPLFKIILWQNVRKAI